MAPLEANFGSWPVCPSWRWPVAATRDERGQQQLHWRQLGRLQTDDARIGARFEPLTRFVRFGSVARRGRRGRRRRRRLGRQIRTHRPMRPLGFVSRRRFATCRFGRCWRCVGFFGVDGQVRHSARIRPLDQVPGRLTFQTPSHVQRFATRRRLRVVSLPLAPLVVRVAVVSDALRPGLDADHGRLLVASCRPRPLEGVVLVGRQANVLAEMRQDARRLPGAALDGHDVQRVGRAQREQHAALQRRRILTRQNVRQAALDAHRRRLGRSVRGRPIGFFDVGAAAVDAAAAAVVFALGRQVALTVRVALLAVRLGEAFVAFVRNDAQAAPFTQPHDAAVRAAIRTGRSGAFFLERRQELRGALVHLERRHQTLPVQESHLTTKVDRFHFVCCVIGCYSHLFIALVLIGHFLTRHNSQIARIVHWLDVHLMSTSSLSSISFTNLHKQKWIVLKNATTSQQLNWTRIGCKSLIKIQVSTFAHLNLNEFIKTEIFSFYDFSVISCS